MLLAERACPLRHARKRSLPQRIDLNGLADARRDHVLTDLRIHPGELYAGLAGAQQAIGWIFPDPKAGSATVPVDNIAQCRKEIGQELLIAARLEIGADGLEVPQRRIDRVVLGRFALVGKAVWQHALTCVGAECTQDGRNIARAIWGDCKTGKHNHRVTPPIAEPRVACDDCGAGGFPIGGSARDDELVGGQGKLSDPSRSRRHHIRQPRLTALQFPGERCFSRRWRLAFGGCDPRDRFARREPCMKVSRPE